MYVLTVLRWEIRKKNWKKCKGGGHYLGWLLQGVGGVGVLGVLGHEDADALASLAEHLERVLVGPVVADVHRQHVGAVGEPCIIFIIRFTTSTQNNQCQAQGRRRRRRQIKPEQKKKEKKFHYLATRGGTRGPCPCPTWWWAGSRTPTGEASNDRRTMTQWSSHGRNISKLNNNKHISLPSKESIDGYTCLQKQKKKKKEKKREWDLKEKKKLTILPCVSFSLG